MNERDRPPAVHTVHSTLVLLQLLDSAFPVGSFTHSYGLEQAVRDGLVRTADDVDRFVAAALELQMAGADARALLGTHDRVNGGDLPGILTLDAALYATKPSTEMRNASTAMGRRLLQEVVAHPEASSVDVEWYLDRIESRDATGLHPVALGVVGASLGVPREELVGAFLFSTASTMHQAVMRLLPVSHRDAQAALHRVRSQAAGLIPHVDRPRASLLESFAPLHEIASMRHEHAAVRFFAS